MIAALLLAAAVAATPDCTPAAIQQEVSITANKMQSDLAAAKAMIAPVLSCPVDSSPAYYAHVLRAEIAVRENDWAAVRPALAGIGFHPESKISVRAAAFVLRTDTVLGDVKAFAGDRMAIIAGNDAMLSKAGKKIETFRVGSASVTAYEANIIQGVLHRFLEFVIVPDDESSYPRSILLTDDVGAAAGQSEALKQINGTHAWFIDAYSCFDHQTLDMQFGSSQPTYENVKALVIKSLDKGVSAISSSTQRSDGLCSNLNWILPGLGARSSPPGP